MNGGRVARGLGWFSLALGAAELAMPGRIAQWIGVRERNGLVRSFGLREILAGVGLLRAARTTPWLWARVAGDALDLGALAAAAPRSRQPSALGAALAGVAAVTALDLVTAARGGRSAERS